MNCQIDSSNETVVLSIFCTGYDCKLSDFTEKSGEALARMAQHDDRRHGRYYLFKKGHGDLETRKILSTEYVKLLVSYPVVQ